MNPFYSRLERKLKHIKTNKNISQKNRKLILSFVEKCFAEGIRDKRIYKYIITLPKVLEVLNKDFDKATKDDMQRFVIWLEKSDYAEWTKKDYKIAIKKFYKTMFGDGEEYPDVVKKIKTNMKNRRNKLPEEILTQKDIKKVVEVTWNIRDKALVSVLYESGARISELLALQIKHVTFSDSIAKITVPNFCKTGLRKIPLVTSVPALSNWIENHPFRNNQNSYVWVNLSNSQTPNKPINYGYVNSLLKDLGKKAGVKKPLNPHSFRHARATHLATRLTEAQMKEFFGWTQASEMASIYVHLSGRDVDNAILQIHGLKKPEQSREDGELEPKKCVRCGKLNEVTTKICCNCGLALNIETAMNYSKEREQVTNMLEELIEKKFNQMLKERGI